ncbi:hypothetical protein LZ198_21670 [Myxococcus sp. K15C18031901]|uniref:hypothetical protein n=1 Tax=Myxococcus dinghuensis TaxID=2906761 RepID=UPI0020A7FB99|nr:hypothetical protein [Myxococcus dinghuensis]MCP3101488.1 hypothetical protein [Myxococcus dinghuensis]
MNASPLFRLGCAVILLAGCGMPPPDDSAPTAPSGGDEALLEDIIVNVTATGEVEQYTLLVTRAEREAQEATRMRQQAGLDGQVQPHILPIVLDCNNPSALWLYSSQNYGGSRLCLNRNPADGIGVLDLSKVVYLTVISLPVIIYWNGQVRSLWAGAEGGNLAQCDLVKQLCYTGAAPYVGFVSGQRIPAITADTRLNTAWLSI